MRGCCADIYLLFIYHQPVVKGFIVGIICPRETFRLVDLEVVPTGVCGFTVTTDKER